MCSEVADRGRLRLGLWITKDGIQGQDGDCGLLSQALACSDSLMLILGGIAGERHENTESTEDPRKDGASVNNG